MTLKDVKKSLLGKTISYYDSFNGDSKYFPIEDITKTKDGSNIILHGKDYWKNDTKVYLPISGLDAILNTGNYKEPYTIDHCYCEYRYKIA